MDAPATPDANTPAAPPAPAPATPPAVADAPAAPKLEMPAGFPAKYWDPEASLPKLDDLTKEFTRLSQQEVERAAADAGRPAKPEEFKTELPKDFKLPGDFQVKFDPKDPLVAEAQKFAVAHKLDQQTFSGLLALRAQMLAKEHADAIELVNTEKSKLGERGAERITAVKGWLGSNLTADQASSLGDAMTSAAAFEAIETLIARANGGSIPATGGSDTKHADATKSHAERIWGQNAFNPNPQAKVG